MIAEQTKHAQYLEDEYEYEMLLDEDDFIEDEFEDYDDEAEFEQPIQSSRWTLRRLVITLMVLVIAAAVLVFVLLPLVDGWINPAIPLNLPTPIKT